MKTIIIVFLLVWLIPIWVFCLVHFSDFRKAWAKTKWWTVIYVVGAFGLLTQWIMFIPAWLLRNFRFNPFWIWLDDERIKNKRALFPKNRYSQDYFNYLNGNQETFFTAYKWHMRNKVWNLQSLIRPRKGERKLYEMEVNHLIMEGKKVNQMQSWIPMARLKYWNNGVEGDNVNKGDKISFKYSIVGKGYLWEKIGKRLTFRYSFLKSFAGFYWNFVAGENDKRFVFSFKIKRIKEIL